MSNLDVLIGNGKPQAGVACESAVLYKNDSGELDFTLNYDDIQFPTSGGRVPAANTPSFETFTSNTNAFSFAVNDYIDLSTQEPPHSWKEGENFSFHCHIYLKAAQNSGANRFVKFQIFVSSANYNGITLEENFSAELTIPTGSASLTGFFLLLGSLNMSDKKLGSQITVRLKRIPSTGGTEYSGNIFVTQVGAHFLQNTLGSLRESSKI